MAYQINDEEIEIYQDLLRLEVNRFTSSQSKDFKSALLDKSEISQIIGKYSNGTTIFNNLLKKGMIIEYCGKYRTAHMDLLAKAAFIRPFINIEPYSLEFDIMLNEEVYPDFGSVSVNQLLQIINSKLSKGNLSQDQINIIDEIITRLLKGVNINGLSSFQGYMIDKILNTDYTYIPLVAPTATGKTIIFVIPSIIYLLESIFKEEKPINVIFVYPRKALAKDQVEKLIKYFDIINDELSKRQINKKITIALDDGDTPKNKKEIKQNESYRGLKCPRCQKGDLIYKNDHIECSNCGEKYDFIIPTKDEIKSSPPNVIVTNIWTLYRRLLNMNTVHNFKNVKYIVFDEVHAYDGVLYHHLRFILRLLFSLKQNATKIEKIIFSSATIPHYKEFISKLVCCGNTNCIANIETYDDYYKNNKNNLSKKRLILYEFLLPNVERGIETLTEDVTEVVLAWLKEHNFKGILFADSISSVTNFYKYFKNTILGERKAREIRDHICYNNPNDLCNNNEYYWPYLSNYRNSCNNDKNLDRLASDLSKGIEQHYSILSLQKRSRIEEEFKNSRDKLLLFSTSTLELGIDIGDVAAIVQHKLPLSKESFIQRIGRAGRSNETYRIATGIIILQPTPFASLYMFNRNLRDSLINANYTSLLKSIDATNIQIIFQYILSYLLLKRAINHQPTCIDDTRNNNCEELLRDLINEAYNYLNNNIQELQNALCIDLGHVKDDLLNLINRLLKMENGSGNEDSCKYIVNKLNEDISNLLSAAFEAIDKLLKLSNIAEYKRLQYIINDIYDKTEQLDYILNNSSGNLSDLKKVLTEIQNKGEKLKLYINNLEEQKSNLERSSEDMRKKMENRKDIPQKDIMKKIWENDELISQINDIIKLLNDIVDKINTLIKRSFDIIDYAKECLDTFSYFNNTFLSNDKDQYNNDIFTLMRKKYNKHIYVDLLMTPPSPTIELIGIEEADDYE